MNTSSMDIMTRRGISKDLPMMDAYINATHPSISSKRIPFADYLTNWDEAKERGGLFQLFGGKTIISKEVTFTRSRDEMYDNPDIERELRSKTTRVCDYLCDISRYILRNVFKITDPDTLRKFVRSYGDHSLVPYSRNNDESDRRYFTSRGFITDLLLDNPTLHDFFDIVSILYATTIAFDTWFDNKMVWDYNTITEEFKNPSVCLPDYDRKFRLTLHQKPIRALTGFANYLHTYMTNSPFSDKDFFFELLENFKNRVEELRLYVSMMNNQNTLKGILSVSIHPFDYMTMSDPDNGWTSCMRWEYDNPGEYHAGTLEMMTSPCVVVAYLESKSTINPAGINYEWNKKKWRELFIVDKNFISGIKGYPYCNEKLEDNVFSILNDLAKENWGVSYNLNNVAASDDNIFRLKDSYFRFITHYMYNDRAYNYARAVTANNVDIDFNVSTAEIRKVNLHDYEYGENCFCLCCGRPRDKHDENETEELLICTHCDSHKTCEHCGERISEDEAVILGDGTILCEDCADNMCNCDYCGDLVFPEDLNNIAIRYKDPSDNAESVFSWWPHHSHNACIHITVCDECYNNFRMNGFFENYYGVVDKVDDKLLELCYKEKPELRNGKIKLIAEWVGKGEKPACFE